MTTEYEINTSTGNVSKVRELTIDNFKTVQQFLDHVNPPIKRIPITKKFEMWLYRKLVIRYNVLYYNRIFK